MKFTIIDTMNLKNYCLENIAWIDKIPPSAKQEQIKETVFIELRCLPYLFYTKKCHKSIRK